MFKQILVAALALTTPLAAWSQNPTILVTTAPTAGLVVPVNPQLQPGCPATLTLRSAQQVWADHLDALQNGQVDRAMCDYAANAKVIMPGSVVSGAAAIRTGFVAFAALVGGAIPTITTVTIDYEIVLSTFTLLDSPTGVTIPDGSDTFVVRFGLIQYQTVHAALAFGTP
jgi:hypothetical protein